MVDYPIVGDVVVSEVGMNEFSKEGVFLDEGGEERGTGMRIVGVLGIV